METKKKTKLDLTEGSPFQLIIRFAIPLILGNLLQQLYNFADTMIVGHFLGVDALAGVGATASLNFLVLGFCMGMCSGFVIPVAQTCGAKDYVALRKYVANALYLSLLFSVTITTVISILCRPILMLMQTPENCFQYAYIYILTIFLGIPITFLYNILAGFIRSIGDSMTPFIFLCISMLINVGLDLLFIGTFSMGVFGAALATVFAQLLSCLMCLGLILNRIPVLHIKKDEWKPDGNCMKKLIMMGLPMGLQYSVTAIGSVILQSSVNGLGSLAVAAVTSASRVNMLFISVLDGLGASMATWGGQNLGAGKIDRVRQGTKAAVLMGVGYSLIAVVAVFFVRRPLIYLFVKNPLPEMVEMSAMHTLITTASLSLLVLVNVLRFLIQGVGYSAFAILAGLFEMIARTVAGIVLIPLFGFVGACVASPFAWLLADCFLVPAYFYVVKRLKRLSGKELAENS